MSWSGINRGTPSLQSRYFRLPQQFIKTMSKSESDSKQAAVVEDDEPDDW